LSRDAAVWRPMQDRDLAQIETVTNEIHTLSERAAVFAEKFELCREGCFVLDRTGTILGYGISHPWTLYAVPALDTLLGRIPSDPDCLYIHDVAIVKAARGEGHSQALCETYLNAAMRRGLTKLALVAVYGTVSLWAKRGFAVADKAWFHPDLDTYGSSARYMIRDVASL
jgi:GNAT superfamily N-acetyltransferase